MGPAGRAAPPSPPRSRAPANGPAEAVLRLVGPRPRGPKARFAASASDDARHHEVGELLEDRRGAAVRGSGAQRRRGRARRRRGRSRACSRGCRAAPSAPAPARGRRRAGRPCRSTRLQKSRSAAPPAARARITGSVILRSRKSSPVFLPRSALDARRSRAGRRRSGRRSRARRRRRRARAPAPPARRRPRRRPRSPRRRAPRSCRATTCR